MSKSRILSHPERPTVAIQDPRALPASSSSYLMLRKLYHLQTQHVGGPPLRGQCWPLCSRNPLSWGVLLLYEDFIICKTFSSFLMPPRKIQYGSVE